MNSLMRLYNICYVMHGSMLSSESNYVIFLCFVHILFESVCYTLRKNSCNSFFIVLYLFFTVIISGIVHVDVKRLIDLGFVI